MQRASACGGLHGGPVSITDLVPLTLQLFVAEMVLERAGGHARFAWSTSS